MWVEENERVRRVKKKATLSRSHLITATPLFLSNMAQLLATRIGLLPVSIPRVSFARCFSETSDGPRVAPLSPEKTQILRDWAEKFKDKELDKTIAGCDIRYDRAGGAGGQVSTSCRAY